MDNTFDFTFVKYLYDKFKDILYNDTDHSYKHSGLNRKLISVTQSLKLFEPEFKKDYWLKVKAKERGISVQELESEWDRLKVEGLTKGTKYHNYIENKLVRKTFTEPIPEINEYLDSVHDIPLLLEFVVGNHCIAGTLDNLSLRDNSLVIKDYKTNKKFEYESKYKLTNGLEHIPNTEYYKYALQLSLYQVLLGLDIKTREIIWFNNNTHQIIDIPFLEAEANYIIDYVNKQNYSRT